MRPASVHCQHLKTVRSPLKDPIVRIRTRGVQPLAQPLTCYPSNSTVRRVNEGLVAVPVVTATPRGVDRSLVALPRTATSTRFRQEWSAMWTHSRCKLGPRAQSDKRTGLFGRNFYHRVPGYVRRDEHAREDHLSAEGPRRRPSLFLIHKRCSKRRSSRVNLTP